MGTSVVPKVIDALVAQLTTALSASPVIVSDGMPVTEDVADYLMIGVDAPNSMGAMLSATSDQQPATQSTQRTRDENGSITCAAYSINGDSVAKTARDNAYSYMAAVENLLRTTPNLGLATGAYLVVSIGQTLQLSQNQDDNGADALLLFDVRFYARI